MSFADFSVYFVHGAFREIAGAGVRHGKLCALSFLLPDGQRDIRFRQRLIDRPPILLPLALPLLHTAWMYFEAHYCSPFCAPAARRYMRRVHWPAASTAETGARREPGRPRRPPVSLRRWRCLSCRALLARMVSLEFQRLLPLISEAYYHFGHTTYSAFYTDGGYIYFESGCYCLARCQFIQDMKRQPAARASAEKHTSLATRYAGIYSHTREMTPGERAR